jgi:mRNA-degrading endonuclease toxin of MazEF toxin-antitoxin module
LFRGGVYLADIGLPKHKLVVIVSDDGINMGLRQPVVARITDNARDQTIETSVAVDAGVGGLNTESFILCHDLNTLEDKDFVTCYGRLPFEVMVDVERKLRIALRLD